MSSHNFLGGMLQSVQEAYPDLLDTQVLKTLFPSLFMALVARNTNIIIHTSSQPAEIQKSTAKVLSTVFGVQAKRVNVRSPQPLGEFMESLFVSPSSGSSSSKRRPSRTSLPPPSSHFTEGSDSTVPPPSASRLPRPRTEPRTVDTRLVYLPQVVVISNLERASRAAQLALAEALRNRQIILDTTTWKFPEGFFVVYVSQVGDGYERPAVHTTLLDHFAFSITLAQTATPMPTSSPSPRISSLPNFPQTPSRKTPLFPYDRLPQPDSTYTSPSVTHYVNALITAARHHPELDGTFLTVRCVKDAEKLVRAAGLVFREDEDMTITEAHVRRVVPPILAHRLRVRDGPRDQIMGILWEGAGVRNWGRSEETQQGRRTIRTILAEILAEV